MADSLRKLPPYMTVDEFLAWDGGGHQGKLELVDGIVRARGPANVIHGLLQTNITCLVGAHNRPRNRARAAISPPVSPRLRSMDNVRYPDFGVTEGPISAAFLFPDPLLLADIIWEEDVEETRNNIWAYATIPSLREILIIHSTAIRAEVFRRGADGAWPERAEIIEAGGMLRLASIEAEFPMAEVYWGTYLASKGASEERGS